MAKATSSEADAAREIDAGQTPAWLLVRERQMKNAPKSAPAAMASAMTTGALTASSE